MLPSLVSDTVSTDLRRALDAALLWGLEAIALRTVGRQRVPDVNEPQVRRLLSEADMPLAAIDPGLFEGSATAPAAGLDDLESLASLAPFCARLNCQTVIVGPLAAERCEVEHAGVVLRRAGDVAAKHGLHLAVRNEGACATAASLAALMEATGHPAVSAWWSVATSRKAGEAPLAGAQALSRVAVRGLEADEAFAEEAPEASGLVPLVRSGFEGAVALAFEERAGNGLSTATALIRSLRRARRMASGET